MTLRFLNTDSRRYANASARMNERITLHIKSRSGRNDLGVPVETTRDVRVWAEVRQSIGDERRIDGIVDHRAKVFNIWIRYRTDLDSNDAITLANGDELTISDIAEVGAKHMLKIRAEVGQT